MTVTIAVVIPAYNVEKYIQSSIKSVLNQSVKFDELVIVDDGSKDSTLNLIRSFDYDIPTKIISQKNSGQGIARNAGIQSTTSDYCYFFDSDDLLDFTACETMKEKLELNNLPDIFFFEGKIFNDNQTITSEFSPTYERPFYGSFLSKDSFLTRIIKSRDLSCSPCLYVSKRELWEDCKLSFNSYYHEDEEVFYKLIMSADKFVISQDVLFYRRVRANSTMTMAKVQKHLLGQEAILKTLLAQLILSDSSVVQRAIRKRLSRFTKSYYRTALEVGEQVDYSLLMKALLASRDLRLLFAMIRKAFLR